MTSQHCPAWLAVFSPATRKKHSNEELIAFMHSFVADKRPVIGRMLKGYDAYVALTGHDLHDKSVDGVNAFKVVSAADRRTEFPFNSHKAKLFADMYEGAALLHSKKTFVEACLTDTGPKNRLSGTSLVANTPIAVNVDANADGLKVNIFHHSSTVIKPIRASNQPVASVVKETVHFNLPKDFEVNAVKLSWQELEQNFGVTKDLFDVHSVMNDDPLMALQGAYKATHTQEVQESYSMDFSESDGQVTTAAK